MKRFDNDHDVGMRLRKSVIRVGRLPVWVERIEGIPGEWELHVVPLDGGLPFCVMLEENDVDLTPVPLGYVNLGDRVAYVQRIPARKYKQGLNNENFWGDVDLRGNDLANCILGKYPTYAKAIETVIRMQCDVAFSRHWAVAHQGHRIMYRGRDVGHYKEDGKVELSPGNEHLIECLQEAGGEV